MFIEQQTGRPGGKPKADQTLVVAEKRREVSHVADPLPSKPKENPVTPKVMLGGTGSRPSLYLVGNPPEKLRNAKLPTTGAVLGRYLDNNCNKHTFCFVNISCHTFVQFNCYALLIGRSWHMPHRHHQTSSLTSLLPLPLAVVWIKSNISSDRCF